MLTLPAKLETPVTYRLPPMPTPPATVSAPVVELMAGLVPLTMTVVLLVSPATFAATVALRVCAYTPAFETNPAAVIVPAADIGPEL